jgi:hypothetical protein
MEHVSQCAATYRVFGKLEDIIEEIYVITYTYIHIKNLIREIIIINNIYIYVI